MGEVILNGEGLTKEFEQKGGEVAPVIKKADIELAAGSLTVLVGPSGSGKSTLIGILSGLDRPTSGRILYAGEDMAKWPEARLARFRRENVGFVFQTWELIPILTGFENVCLPLYPSSMGTRKIKARASELLKRVGMIDRAFDYPRSMSGGEQQRVAVARALMNSPKILFADEPTANLDEENAKKILDMLEEQSRSGTCVVLATHDRSLERYADSVYQLKSGRLSRKKN